MWETRVQSLGQEDLLEKEMATHSSVLAWKIRWTEEPGRLQSMGSQRVGPYWVTSLHFMMLGKIESRRRRGQQRMRWLGGITNSWSLLKLMSIESVMPSNHLILCCPRLLPPSISPSIRVFSNESVLHIRWPKYWNFSISISPPSQYSGLISFRIDWFSFA